MTITNSRDGAVFRLSTRAQDARPGSQFEREIAYLKGKGYEVSKDRLTISKSPCNTATKNFARYGISYIDPGVFLMKAEEAYRAIGDDLKNRSTLKVVDSSFDPDHFGNFVFELTDRTGDRSIICDRGQVFVCDGFSGSKNCRLLVPSLYDVTKSDLLAVIDLHFTHLNEQ